MSSENQPFPPSVLFRSFLLVAGAYILNLVCFFTAGLIIAMFLFPDAFAIMNAAPEQFNRVVQEQPSRVFPPEMLWILFAVNAVSCFALGYLVAKLAPVSKFSHAIFLAAIFFAQFLQMMVGANEALRTMLILFVAASPVAVLLGANMFLRRHLS